MNASSPETVNLRGYDPESATRCTTYADGRCLGDSMPHGALVTWDTAVAPVSGECAMIRLPGDILTTKRLEHFAGRWFMGFVDGWLELDRAQCEVLGKVVRIIPSPLSRVLVAEDEAAPPGYRQHLAQTLREVDALTRKYGLDRTTAFPMPAVVPMTPARRLGIPELWRGFLGIWVYLAWPYLPESWRRRLA